MAVVSESSVAFGFLARRGSWVHASHGKERATKIMKMLAMAFPIISKRGESKGSDRIGVENVAFIGGVLPRPGLVWHWGIEPWVKLQVGAC